MQLFKLTVLAILLAGSIAFAPILSRAADAKAKPSAPADKEAEAEAAARAKAEALAKAEKERKAKADAEAAQRAKIAADKKEIGRAHV